MKQYITPLLFVLAVAFAWLPGCLSENNINRKLAEIEGLLRDQHASAGSAQVSREFELDYDTLIAQPDLHWAADPGAIMSGQPVAVEIDANNRMVIQYDTSAGVLRGQIVRRPMHVRGVARIRAVERIDLAPSSAPDAAAPAGEGIERVDPVANGRVGGSGPISVILFAAFLWLCYTLRGSAASAPRRD